MAVRDLPVGPSLGARWNDTNRTVTAIYADPPVEGSQVRITISVGGEVFTATRTQGTSTRGTITIPTRLRTLLTVQRDEKDRFDYIDGYDWLSIEMVT